MVSNNIMSVSPEFSIIIPCLNEEDFIEGCLKSVLEFKLPVNTSFEVLVVDGVSEDNTSSIVKTFSKKDSRIKLLENPGKIQACALNIAIKVARGTWILRLDAHSTYPPEYLKLCYENDFDLDQILLD